MLEKYDLLKALNTLSAIEFKDNFEEGAAVVIKHLEEDPNQHLLADLKHLKNIYKIISFPDCSSSLKYALLSLECLVCLKERLKIQSHEADRLLSVAHQKQVRCLLERVVNLGITPHLLPGVEPLRRTPDLINDSSLTDLQKYECLCLVTLAFIDLCHDDTFHGILVPQFLSPVMSALCQLTMVPLKKSADTYPRLQRERITFQKHLDGLVLKLYQPMVIKELMIIEGNKKCPRWLKRGVGAILTNQLHRPQGLQALVEAVRDAANSAAPSSPAHLEALARVVTSSPDLSTMCPQIIQLLDSSDAELIQFAVICAKTLHNKDPSACNTFLLEPITSALVQPPCQEQHLAVSLSRLHKCFAVPASDLWCLPSLQLHPYIHILFRLYCKIYKSVFHLRTLVEDLVWNVLSNSDEKVLLRIFRCLILKERPPEIITLDGVEFVFGDNGGVEMIINKEVEESLEEIGDCLMILLERRDTIGSIGNNLFLMLLAFAAEEKEMDSVDMFEKQLVTVKLLAVLSENTVVQKSLSKNPEPVVIFLKAMIDSFITGQTSEVDIISVVLVVLNVILNDCIFSKNVCWKVFSQLERPLSNLITKTENLELRLLAEEAYEVIMTHGSVKPKQRTRESAAESTSTATTPTREASACEEALKDACDALLPVRGHAMLQLGKLLAKGDKQAKAKKEQILCIFKENLKHEDSFLYLSAIEGLSIAATEFPDNVIVSLAEQFSHSSLKPDTRLKVGEALVRVTKLLGDLVPVYKAELTNAFLAGTRDDDPLVRASSLSGLGELCRVLSFRVGPILAEVLVCARCIFSSDPSVEVRRAAVMLVSLLLKGLHKDALIVLQDVLVELYQSLKRIYSSDKDDVTRIHAQLALEELNSGTLAFLFPKPQLTKQIFILDPPS